MKRILLFLFIVLPTLSFAQPSLRLPAILSDHAVLQASTEVKLWGWGPSTVPLKIVASWSPSDTITIMPKKDWTWETTVKTPKAGGPYTISFTSGKQNITIHDILTGEVWLCSGQSNMEFNYNWGSIDTVNVEETTNQQIRFFQPTHLFDDYPQSNTDGEWKICDASSMPGFSLVGYFFGRKLNSQLHKPVGLIGSYWGGSCVQAWTPKEAYKGNNQLRQEAEDLPAVSWSPVAPSVIYNAMIHPILNYKIAGTIWYQGEQNTDMPQYYGDLFKAMITSWRKEFHSDFPFYFVQIAPWSGYGGISGAIVREQQASALSLPKTGMVTVGDLVDDVTNIHPKSKQPVGERLANLALKEVYGFNDLQPYQPQFDSMTIKGNKAFISVKSIGKLTVKGKSIESFQIAGSDEHFYPAEAKLRKDGTIEVSSKEVKHPVAVRYCFTNGGMPNLFDTNGLPLVPFRTDDWSISK